jgi:hypothetical protein
MMRRFTRADREQQLTQDDENNNADDCTMTTAAELQDYPSQLKCA